MTVIYLDRVLLLNFMADYLLLLASAQVVGIPLRRLRLALAAAAGALYAAAVYYRPVLANPIARLFGGIILVLLAFTGEPRPWRPASVFFLLSGALAGLLLALGLAAGSPAAVLQRVYYADINYGILLLSFLMFYLLLSLLFHQAARYGKEQIMDITVSLGVRRCRLRALHDTGNTLRNPVDGKPVLVAEAAALRCLWDSELSALLESPISAEEKMVCLYRMGYTVFSLLPYRSIGTETGLLLAVRCDDLVFRDRTVHGALVALYPGPVGRGGYHALWGGRGDGNEMAATPASLDTTLQAG